MSTSDLDKTCTKCGDPFVAKERGFNALYCSGTCRNRARRARMTPEVKSAGRRREYVRIKDNPQRLKVHREGASSYRAEVRAWLADYKLERGCTDCGYKGHFAALQLDHTGPKTAEIADCRSSIARLQAEIESGRCVVRCANCHSIKTWKDKQS